MSRPMTSVSLTEWLWQSSLLLAGCGGLYYGLLRRETCLRYNRLYLLLTPALAALGPLLPHLGGWSAPVPPPLVAAMLPPLPAAPTILSSSGSTPGGAAAPLPWLPLLYGAGVLAQLLGLSWQLGRLWWLARRLPVAWQADYTLRLTGGRLPTSSFVRQVFWDDTQPLTAAEARQVLLHEQAHVRQGHSAEQLWLRLWQAVFWFHPVVYWYARTLALIHECLADAAVVTEAPGTAAEYIRLLARQTVRPWWSAALPQAFAAPHTLHRIAMLPRLSRIPSWRQWLALPFLGTVLALAACERQEAPPIPGPVYAQVEQMPQPPGDLSLQLRQVVKSCPYPTEAREAGLQGIVLISFVVGADGQPGQIALQQSFVDELRPLDNQVAARQLREAALQAVTQSLKGRWQPGRQAGRPVAVSQLLAIGFSPCEVLQQGQRHAGHRVTASWRNTQRGGFYQECRPD